MVPLDYISKFNSTICQIFLFDFLHLLLQTAMSDLYSILNLTKDANTQEIKKAYRTLALKHHPDKQGNETLFVQIANAYSILVDPISRNMYDLNGSYKDSFSLVSSDAINLFSKEYRGSQEEVDNLLEAYTRSKGDMDYILEHVMLSSASDQDRFRVIIDQAIADKLVKSFKKYTNDTKADRDRRIKVQLEEEAEADAISEGVGLKEGGLKEMILAKQGERKMAFDGLYSSCFFYKQKKLITGMLSSIEEKFVKKSSTKASKKGKKNKVEELMPTEEEFAALQKKYKK